MLLAIGVVLLLARFYSLGNAPFVQDEPLFQMMVDKAFAEGKFPVATLLGSSLPIRYGAAHLWFYAIPRYFSAEPMPLILFHTIFCSLGFLFFYFAMKRAWGGLAAAWGFALACSSSFLFHLTRHPWDTTLFLTISAAVLWLFVFLEDNRANAKKVWAGVIGLALLSAFGINLHLSVGPFLLALGCMFLWQLYRSPLAKRVRWGMLAAYAGLVFVLILPYMLEAIASLENIGKIPTSAQHNSRWGDARHFWWNLQFHLLYLSTWRAKLYFEPGIDAFFAHGGPFLERLLRWDVIGWIPKAGAAVFLTIPLVKILRGRVRELHSIHLFAGLVFFFCLLVQQYLNIPMADHYFQASWWLAFMAVGVLAVTLRGRFGLFFQAAAGLTLLLNTAFFVLGLAFIDANHGTRGMNIGTGISELRDSAARACILARANNLSPVLVDLSEVFVMPASQEYFARHIPECEGIKLRFTKAPDPNARIQYQYPETSLTNAALVVRVTFAVRPGSKLPPLPPPKRRGA